jgi:DNA-binding FadR family transcriptional regulator
MDGAAISELLRALERALEESAAAFAAAESTTAAESALRAHVAVARCQAQAYKLILEGQTTGHC